MSAAGFSVPALPPRLVAATAPDACSSRWWWPGAHTSPTAALAEASPCFCSRRSNLDFSATGATASAGLLNSTANNCAQTSPATRYTYFAGDQVSWADRANASLYMVHGSLGGTHYDDTVNSGAAAGWSAASCSSTAHAMCEFTPRLVCPPPSPVPPPAPPVSPPPPRPAPPPPALPPPAPPPPAPPPPG